MMARFRNTLLATTALMPIGIIAAGANPLGSQVVGGTASVQGQGTSTVTVTQSSERAIVNWQTFNIGAGETTRFNQPGSSSVTLNRVTGGLGASALDGTLTANGRVFLVNPDGILFGAGAKVNTGSFLATTNDIRNADFMAGRYEFSIPGRIDASIVNFGTITAQNGGFAALVAPGVRNAGTIIAKLGTVGLAAGNNFSLDFYGDRLITLGVNDAIAAKVVDVATGQPLNALVKNEGKLKANGGRVELTAASARRVVDAVINNTGVVEANSIGKRNGMIVLGAATNSTKFSGAPIQTVKLSGKLSAAGKRNDAKGGTIVVTGENIQLTSSTIDASGQAGGGNILIGGDVGGGKGNAAVPANPNAAVESFSVATASTVSVDASTTINASAKSSGGGGKIVVWSDQATTFDGTIRAQGGPRSGNGGFVETSGRQTLTFNGAVDTSASRGTSGTLLLDPLNVKIDGNPGNQIITVSSIQNALASSNVVVSTNVSGAQPGNITVAATVAWSSSNTLSLVANNDIAINAPLSGPNGELTLSGANLTATAALSVRTFTLQSGQWKQVGTNLSGFGASDFRILGGSFVRALGGDGTAGSPYQITDVYGLQGIPLVANIALANNIDASATANWNSGAGFAPISFGGSFNGQGHTISNLTINSAFPEVGLFSRAYGTIENLHLTNASIKLNTGSLGLGVIAGQNIGSIKNVSSSGLITGHVGAIAGGLVGANNGLISQSSSSVSISGSSYSGGLVGSNSGTITESGASGNVTGMSSGGLAALNGGTILRSFATGSANANGGPDSTGLDGSAGLVGSNYQTGKIIDSFATGTVSGPSPSLGGLVGNNSGSIIGSYSIGKVVGSAPFIGGLVGRNTGSTVNSYWDVQTSGRLRSAGGTGLTTIQLTSTLPSGFNNSVWGISSGSTYPYLLWQLAGTRPLAPAFSTPIPITVTADSLTTIYGNADPSLTYQMTSGTLFGGDTFSGSLTRVPGASVGIYTIVQGTLSLSRSYALTYQGANLTIVPRPLTLTADAKGKTFGDPNPLLTYAIGGLGLVKGDTLSGALTTPAMTTSSVGKYAITQGTLSSSSNYAVSYVGADLSVVPKAVTVVGVAADAKSKTYGASDPALTFAVKQGALIGSDTFSGSLTRSPGENVGSYPILRGTLSLSSNYALNYQGANLTIVPRPLTLTADAKGKTFGDPNPLLTYAIGGLGLVKGDTLSGALTTPAMTTSSVGKYAITQGTLSSSSNYAVSYVGADLTVVPKAITVVGVAADAKSKTYGTSDPALTFHLTQGGLVGSDTFSGSLTRSLGENVGNYPILQGTLSLSSNYALTYQGANLTIVLRPLTVTADAKSKTFGDANPLLTYAIGGLGLVNADKLNGSLATTATTNSAVGTYPITQETLANSNYAITYVGANLKVTAAATPTPTPTPTPTTGPENLTSSVILALQINGSAQAATQITGMSISCNWVCMLGGYVAPIFQWITGTPGPNGSASSTTSEPVIPKILEDSSKSAITAVLPDPYGGTLGKAMTIYEYANFVADATVGLSKAEKSEIKNQLPAYVELYVSELAVKSLSVVTKEVQGSFYDPLLSLQPVIKQMLLIEAKNQGIVVRDKN